MHDILSILFFLTPANADGLMARQLAAVIELLQTEYHMFSVRDRDK